MDNLTPNSPAPDVAPAAPGVSEPEVDFSAMEATSTAIVLPANGAHLCRIAGFEPAVDAETGTVTQWRLTLDAAEDIPDDQKPPGTIPEGSRLGTFTMFVAPSQYRKLEGSDGCMAIVKVANQAFNNIVRDPRKDFAMKSADAAWNALPAQQRRPAFTGTPPMLDADLEWYSQWIGTLVLATLNHKLGDIHANLNALSAKDGPRVVKGSKK